MNKSEILEKYSQIRYLVQHCHESIFSGKTSPDRIEEQIEIAEQKNFGEIFQLVEPKSPPKPSNQPTGGEEKIISHFSPAFWHKPTSSLPNDAAEYICTYNGMGQCSDE